MSLWSRRKFFLTSLAGTAAAGTTNLLNAKGMVVQAGNGEGASSPFSQASNKGKRPVMISSANGVHALEKGMDILRNGGDTLEAAVAAVTVVEDDPNDDSVGYGGLPNEEGEVELDASVMHGPTRRAGSVASVRRIKNVARLAKTVMERTNHTMIVGDGARRFAVAEGFEEMNLLTEHSRKIWLAWKASTSFNWRPGIDSPEWNGKTGANEGGPLDSQEFRARLADICGNDKVLMARAMEVITDPPTGTINCLAVNEKGEISGTTTTSGLSWKIPGRVGDSPIIGAGLYVDGDVGGAGSTGKGEENIKISGGHTIVEMMRKGMSPTDACLEALHRVARNYNNDKNKLGTFHIYFYALNKSGVHGSASLWRNGYDPNKRAKYAVHDGTEGRLQDCAAYFDEVSGGG
ncbi:MAG TPA: N(4)-(beta-N-acetylglucosaminyl)-L-asparaginase [Candidatus Eisenbacteria bacterium]|jgi:N4-(beta-N-acetylglucosaminyl)-L-asparaginase|nr:N(4)-(beta-N-acetylglucosaminyl)-L-asparaginase [Candidatus Eisenbacteria bacterium]